MRFAARFSRFLFFCYSLFCTYKFWNNFTLNTTPPKVKSAPCSPLHSSLCHLHPLTFDNPAMWIFVTTSLEETHLPFLSPPFLPPITFLVPGILVHKTFSATNPPIFGSFSFTIPLRATSDSFSPFFWLLSSDELFRQPFKPFITKKITTSPGWLSFERSSYVSLPLPFGPS